MGDALLHVYHQLPAPLRSVAATLRGRYLKSWRYGPESEQLVAQTLERDHWTPERWRVWRDDRLAQVLHRAATNVPYYREQWAARRRAGDTASIEILDNWPVLEKETLRRRAREFVAADRDVRQLFHEYTSGTTGKSLDLWWSREAVRAWYAIFEARCRRWYNVSRHERWAMLAGQLVTPVHQQRPPFWVWNGSLNQLYMSSYHLAPAFLAEYLQALIKYRITHLSGYTSAIFALAQEVVRQRRRDLTMRVAITNAEPVLDHQRAIIAEAFGCPVCETYGQAEIVACASECREGTLHAWPEVGHFEMAEGGRRVPDGEPGDVIGTSLLNLDMPLIRYRLGDRGTMPKQPAPCRCGSSLPVVEEIEGRADDVVYTRDGRRVGRLDPVFKAHLPVREAQIIQEALDRVRVRFVPSAEFTPDAGESIAARLRARLGDVDVVLESVTEIPRTSRGKFRAVVCNLSETERQSVAALSGNAHAH